MALLLAGAEPEELATVVTASVRGVDGIAFGDVIGANAAVATVAIGAAQSLPWWPSATGFAATAWVGWSGRSWRARSSGTATSAPISIARPAAIRLPYLAMVALMVLVLALAMRRGDLDRREGIILLCGYPCFVAVALLV